MIAGIGTDILYMNALSPDSLKAGDPFLVKTYTEKEIEEASERPNPLMYYADRFAGKEAVFKSLRITPEHVQLREIEILTDENGAPAVKLHGALAEAARMKKITAIHISLSYMEEYAVAFAVAENE